MESALSNLQDRRFDVIVIGGGINGASAAQNLAAAGYNCLVVDKGDFGSGASEKSARMLHIGLRFFEAENPVKYFMRHPGLFLNALRGGRQAMLGVSEHVVNPGRRILPYRMCFPVYRDSGFKTWHLRAGLGLLSLLGDGSFSLDHEIIRRDYTGKIPFFNDLRDPGKLLSIACYNEFKFDWPERFCVDMLLDAQRNGACILNYCKAEIKEKDANGAWMVSLRDTSNGYCSTVDVSAPVVLNLAGTWADKVLPPDPARKPIVHMSKGSHIMVEMPDTYKGFGIAGVNRYGLPFYVLPFHKNLFSVGVTELPFDGDATNVSCSDEEIDFLIEECNAMLPGRRLRKEDVVSTWSGVRPLTYSEDPLGTRVRKIHDLASVGCPGIITMTGGPIMSHRSTGRLILDIVLEKLKPSGRKGHMNHEPFEFSGNENSEAFLADQPEVRVADLENSVRREYAKTLTDVLLRRTSLAWRRRLTISEARKAAQIVGPFLHWSDEEQRTQVEQFMAFQEDVFRIPGSGCKAG